jgi:hypothetical protein
MAKLNNCVYTEYAVINGRWNAPNLNMKTNADKFDLFINMHRNHELQLPTRVKRNFRVHNYKFPRR